MAEENTEAEESGGGSKKLIIIIGAAVVLLLIIGVAVYFLFLKKPPAEETKTTAATEIAAPTIEQQSNIGPMLDIKEFIVNIISEDTPHYVKASLTLELSNELVAEEATSRMPQIRDAVLLLIGNKTYEELQDLQGKKQLKAELKTKINSFLKAGKINNIYLTDFVVQ